MTGRESARADGGVVRGPSEGRDIEGDGIGLDVDLPADSLFTLEEYLEMYDVASSEPAFGVLCALCEEGRLSAGELGDVLGREGNELHYYLRKLTRCALVRNRRDPNTGTEESYSYYTLTELGETVLTEGLKTGIEKLAREEVEINDEYRE